MTLEQEFMKQIRNAMAKNYRAQLSEAIKRGIRASKQRKQEKVRSSKQ